MVPLGLITAEDMQTFPEYGLIAIGEHNIRVVVEAPQREPDSRCEIIMLVSALRRVRTREFLTLNIVACEEPRNDPFVDLRDDYLSQDCPS